MSTVYRSIFVVIMFSIVMSFMVNFNSDTTTSSKLKSGAELASHDALLSYDELEFVRGKIVFEKNDSRDSFKETMGHNLGVTERGSTTLKPIPGSFFTNNIEIERLVFIDDATKPSDVTTGKLYSIDGGQVETYDDGVVKFPLIYQDNTYELRSGYTSYRDENGNMVSREVDSGLVLERPGIISVLATKSPRWFKGKDTKLRQASAYNFKLSVPAAD